MMKNISTAFQPWKNKGKHKMQQIISNFLQEENYGRQWDKYMQTPQEQREYKIWCKDTKLLFMQLQVFEKPQILPLYFQRNGFDA
jgi:hypothetical protein